MVRKFDTGATRDTDNGKPDYEGFISPLVVERYGEYMHQHRIQSDSTLRDSDNWQKGIPKNEYAKSLWRHHQDHWMFHRGYVPDHCSPCSNPRGAQEELLCAIIFNASGYLHELIKDRQCYNRFRSDCPDTIAGDAPGTIVKWSRWMWDWAWGKR